jgi:hypothetical protein
MELPRFQACSLIHFAMKLFFAAPLSALPSDPTAFGAHASRLHFVMKLVRAAPWSSFPSFPTALLAHVSGACAAAEPVANAISKLASSNRIICFLHLHRYCQGKANSDCLQGPDSPPQT